MSLKAQARKRLLILLSVVVLAGALGGGAFYYRNLRMQRHYADLYQRGMDAVAKGNDAQVVNFLGQYLRRFPSNEQALRLYAKSRPKVPEPNGQHLLDTANVLHHLLQINSENTEDWRQLMKLYSQYGMLTEANEAAKELRFRLPNDGEAMAVQTSVLVGLHDYAAAEQVARLRLVKTPTDWTTQINRIIALKQLHRPDAILVVIDDMDKKYPKEQGSLLVQAIGYEALNDTDNTKNYIDLAHAKLMDAAGLPFKEISVAVPLVRQLDLIDEHDASLNLLQSVVSATGDTSARRLLARRYWEDGRLNDVVAVCTGPTTQPASSASATAEADESDILDEPEILGIYADSLRRLARQSDATTARAKLAGWQNNPDTGKASMAAAWDLVEITPEYPSQEEAKALRAACAQALQHSPNDAYLLYFQGAACAAMGEFGPACNYWENSATHSLTWSLPLVQEARTMLNEGRPDPAYFTAGRAWLRSQHTLAIAVLNASVLYALIEKNGHDPKMMAELNGLIDEIQSKQPGQVQTSIMRVSLLADAGKTNEAIASFRAILKYPQALTKNDLLDLANVSLKWKLGIENECLKTLEDRDGRSAESVLAIALNDWSRHQGDAGLKLLKDAISSAKPDETADYQLALAHYLEGTNDDSATTQWILLGDAYPKNIQVQKAALASPAAYGNLLTDDKAKKVARDYYKRTIDRVHQILGDDATSWKLAKARWDLDYGGNAEATDALALLQDVLRADPQSLSAYLLMATAKSKMGDVAGATSAIQKAHDLDPTSAAITLDMAKLLQYRGSFVEAQQQLQQLTAAAKTGGATPTQQRDTARLLDKQGDIAHAIEIEESLVASPDADQSDRLYLASLYCKVKELDKAQVICDELMKNPNQDVVILAAELEMFRRRPIEAEKVLQTLKNLKPPLSPGQAEQKMGDFYYIFGLLPKAQDFYSQATKLSPNDPLCWLSLMDSQCLNGFPGDALATANEAVKYAPDDLSKLPPEMQQHWANIRAITKQSDLITKVNTIVQQAGGGGKPPETLTRLLSAFIKDPSMDGPAAHTLNTLADLTTRNDLTTDEVIQGLQKLSQDEPRFLPAQTALTEAQLRLGRSEDAVQSATRTVDAFPTETQPVELAVAALQSLNRWDEALQMAQTWRNRLVGDTLFVDMKIAEIDLHLHQGEQAIAAVKPHIDAAYISPDQKWNLLLIQAQALVVEGKPGDAVQLLWTTAQTNPADQVSWMQLVINVLPADQADTWLGKMADYLKTQPNSGDSLANLAGTWDALAHASPINKDQYARSARDLIHFVERQSDAPPMAFYVEGNFDADDKDFKSAEAAYRRAAALKVPQAENNLAMLLAEHGGDLKEAVQMAQQCVNDAPQTTLQDMHYKAAFYDTLATLLERAKDFSGAAQAIESAMHLEPNNAKWHVNLIKLLIEDHKTDEARKQVAVVDLMTPGINSLPPSYKSDLDNYRKQLSAVPVAH